MRSRLVVLALLLVEVQPLHSAQQSAPQDPGSLPPSVVRKYVPHQGLFELSPALQRPARLNTPRTSVRPFESKNIVADRARESYTFEFVPGPEGGTVRSFAADSDGTLYTATDGEVYRSTDNGAHWEMHLFPSQSHSFVEPVTVVAPGTVIAETDWDNFISTDGGDSWDYLNFDVQGFVVDTNGVIYAGSSYGGIKKSIDSAKTWQHFALSGRIFRVVLGGGGRFVCSSDAGLFSSSDGGTSWTFRSDSGVFNASLCGDRYGHLFAIRNNDVWRSSDFGVTWQLAPLPNRIGSGDPYRVYVQKDGTVFVVKYFQIVKSTDAGASWSELPGMPDVPLTVGTDAQGNLLGGCFYGVYRYKPASGGWEELNNGIHANRIEAIQFTSQGSILALSLGRCFRSTDDGMNWSQLPANSAGYVPYYAPLLSCSSGCILVGWFSGSASSVLRSTDDGDSWETTTLSSQYSVEDMTEGSSGDILAGTSFGDIFRSTDQGDSWTKVLSSSRQSAITCIAADSRGGYYAGRDSTVLISRDGVSWSEVPLQRGYSFWESMTVDARDEIYLGSSNGVYHSSDHGQTWNVIYDGFYNPFVMGVAADDSDNVFAATDFGVFRLADSVDSWTPFSAGLPSTFFTSLNVSPQGYVYAGTQDFGMYRTTSPVQRRHIRSAPETVDFRLYQNYPNPFNPGTTIRFFVRNPSFIELSVFDILGRKVATLAQEQFSGGTFTRTWNSSTFPSGVYICRLRAGSFVESRKIVLIR